VIVAEQVIGRPMRVSAREIWLGGTHELIDWFTRHPDALNDALDCSITTLVRPVSAGPRSADLIGEDSEGGIVVAEICLTKSNNAGLGRLLTYSSALGATTVIWVAEEFSAEHIGAVAWLNRCSMTRFFLLQVHGLRGIDGTVSHLVNRILGPSRLIRIAESERRTLVDRSEERRRFFALLAGHESAPVMVPAVRGATSVIHRLTRLAGVTYNFVVEPLESGVEIRIAGPGDRQAEANHIFNSLLALREDLEQAIAPDPLLWESLGSGHFRIALMIPGGFESPEAQWDEIHVHLVESMARLRQAFKRYLHNLARS